jgi:cystathionine beta-lyase
VARVFYPGLPSHHNHSIAKQQATGFGGIVSFILKDDTEAAAIRFVTHTKYFKLAESLGGIKSLLCHPANMTHKSIPAEKRRAAGVADSLIRLSVGLEEAGDLVQDLEQAFHVLQKEKTFIKLADENLLSGISA